MLTTTEFNIDSYLKEQKSIIDNHLQVLFADNKNFTEPKLLWDAVKYSVLDGGKRLRGILCLAVYEALGGSHKEDCLTVASSIEIIHAMSLIHDDLPCMDNDDTRRGKPSCHKAFGEANAILAGDAMLSIAFQFIIDCTKNITDLQKLKVIKTLTSAFSFGLVAGQVLDLLHSSEKQRRQISEGCCGEQYPECRKKEQKFKPKFLQIQKKEIETIYRLKTAELFKASVLCALVISPETNHKRDTIEKLAVFGTKIGIAFQIIDDILDITGDTKTLGKTSGKDVKQKKQTFPASIGVERSKIMANKLIADAKLALSEIPIETRVLFLLIDQMLTRIN